MGWTIFAFVVGCLINNGIFIVFGTIAWIVASKQKSYSGWLIGGFLLNTVPFIGYFSSLKRNPELYSKTMGTEIGYIVFLLVVLGLFIYACKKAVREAEAKKAEEKENGDATVADKKTIQAEDKFICENCGKTSPGWYQTCPNCGAVGKMKKNSGREDEESANIPASNAEKATVNAAEKFICEACGKTSPGWYQTCPNCGAVGKMKKNT